MEDGWASRTAAVKLDPKQYPQGPDRIVGGQARLYAVALDRVILVTGTDDTTYSYSVNRTAYFDLGDARYPQAQYIMYSILEQSPDGYTVDLKASQGMVTWVRMHRK